MSKKQILTLILAATALTAQIAFAADLPANVQNVQASMVNGGLTVTWTGVPGAAFYRVYYSHESILNNGGNYDDFERTLAAETTYTFTKVPLTSSKIFVGVLAVDQAGNESEGFETEASADQPQVAMPAPQTAEPAPEPVNPAPEQPAAMPQGENPTTTAEPMNAVQAEAVSETGVLVTFTKSIRDGASINPAFFVITDSGGTALRITAVTLNGPTALLTTDTQAPERDYTVALVYPIPASDGTNAVPPNPLPFRGFGHAMMEQPAPAPSEPTVPDQNPPPAPVQQQQQPEVPYGVNPLLAPQQQPQVQPGGYGQNPFLAGVAGPTNLDLRATPRKDGTYDVVATWNPIPGVQNYGLYTAVNGQPFAWNSQVGAGDTSVQYRRVQPGTFALRVTGRTPQGQETTGVERGVNLPASGIGLIGVMAAAGAAAGARMRRRKQTV